MTQEKHTVAYSRL